MDAADLTPAPEAAWARVRTGATLAWRATGRGIVEFYKSSNLTFASSIAYYSLLSFFPFVLLVFTALSRVAVMQAGNEQVVIDLVERALPQNFDFLSAQIVAFRRTPIQLTIAGTVLALWASMGVFGAVTSAVNHAWGAERPYGYFKHKLVAFLMMLVAGLVFGLALFAMGAVRMSEASWFGPASDWFPWIDSLRAFASRNALTAASVLAIGLIYYFLPNTKVRLRDVWFGAVLAALLWRLALTGFSWYVGAFSRLGVHGQVGTVVAFLVWVFLSAVILLYGVEVTAAYARLRREMDRDKSKVKS